LSKARPNGREPDRYAVVGNPVAHSQSPLIHAEFAQATGQVIDYTRLLAPIGGFAAVADGFRDGGGRGLNITLPFKMDACAYAKQRSPRAELAGAVNALKFEDGAILGDNFDGVGLVRDVVANLGQPLAGRRILILGAGGAARGVLLPFLAERPAELVIANIEADAAQALARLAGTHADGCKVHATTYGGLMRERFDLVFNATSASLSGLLPPVPVTVFSGCRVAYDLAYGQGLTPFLRLARNAGVATLADGIGMLVEQAAEAFAWWRGVRPDTRTVIDQLRLTMA
jgi:shikimate dehydrogenase